MKKIVRCYCGFVAEGEDDTLHVTTPDLPLTGEWTLESFCDQVRMLDLWPAPVIFDEAQHAPGLLPYIKERIDEDRGRAGQYLLSGSQNLLLTEQVAESLAGRAAILRLLPLSRSELAEEAQRAPGFERQRAALDGSLKNASYRTDPYFGFSVPTAVPGVDAKLLNPIETWKDKTEFDTTARNLVKMFQDNFVKFEPQVDADVRAELHAVRHAEERGPHEGEASDLVGPVDREVEDVAEQDLQRDYHHHHREGRDDELARRPVEPVHGDLHGYARAAGRPGRFDRAQGTRLKKNPPRSSFDPRKNVLLRGERRQ